MSNLYEIVKKKMEIEDIIQENYGEIDEQLAGIWEDNSLELKDKLDSYGHVIKSMNDSIDLIKERKKEKDSKVKQLITSLENQVKRLKARLNQVSQGEKLSGNEYSFTPYMSERSEVDKDIKIEPQFGKYILPPLAYSEYNLLMTAVDQATSPLDDNMNALYDKLNEVTEHKVNVTDLPEGHPAVIKHLEPSVRIR